MAVENETPIPTVMASTTASTSVQMTEGKSDPVSAVVVRVTPILTETLSSTVRIVALQTQRRLCLGCVAAV